MTTAYTSAPDDLPRIRVVAEAEGFCLIKNLFTPAEMMRLLAGMKSFGAATAQGTHHDVLSWEPLRWLLFDSRVLNIARALIGPQPVYYGHSNVDYEETVGPLTLKPYTELHCDAYGMPGDLFAPWQSPTDQIFRAYRFGIYFQDYSRNSGGLKVVPKSHRGDPARLRPRNIFLTPAVEQDVGNRRISFYETHMPVVNMPSEPGDMVVWNLRTFHAAGARVFAADPAHAVHPIMEELLNNNDPTLFAPVVGPRNALFFDYGAPVEEVDLYIKHRALRMDEAQTVAMMSATGDSAEARAAAGAHGVQLRYDNIIYALAAKLSYVLNLAETGNVPPGTDMKWLRGKADALAQRLSALMAGHREFSPHYSLFSRETNGAMQNVTDAVKTTSDEIFRRVLDLRSGLRQKAAAIPELAEV